MWSKYDNVYCIFWTADPFATRLGFLVHYHKPECFMEKLGCYGQGHSFKTSVNVCPNDIFWTPNLLLPNLVWWCNIMSQIVFQKHWFAVFKVKVTVTDNIIKICLFNIWTADPFATKLGLMAHLHKVKRLDCSVVVKVKITEKIQNSSECSSRWYLLSCWPSVTPAVGSCGCRN